MHSRVITLTLWSKRLNAGLAGLVAFCALLYAAFLLMAVAQASGRAEAQSGIEELTAHLASLESEYLALERGVTPARAEGLGLVKPAASTVFADAAAPSLTVGLPR